MKQLSVKSLWAGAVTGILFSLLLTAGSPVVGQVVSGDEVEKRTVQVLERTHWSESMAALQDRAKREKKLIFWLQLVGELDGGL